MSLHFKSYNNTFICYCYFKGHIQQSRTKTLYLCVYYSQRWHIRDHFADYKGAVLNHQPLKFADNFRLTMTVSE